MTHRGPCQPPRCWDSVIPLGSWRSGTGEPRQQRAPGPHRVGSSSLSRTQVQPLPSQSGQQLPQRFSSPWDGRLGSGSTSTTTTSHRENTASKGAGGNPEQPPPQADAARGRSELTTQRLRRLEPQSPITRLVLLQRSANPSRARTAQGTSSSPAPQHLFEGRHSPSRNRQVQWHQTRKIIE